jgi:hypothetical protein
LKRYSLISSASPVVDTSPFETIIRKRTRTAAVERHGLLGLPEDAWFRVTVLASHIIQRHRAQSKFIASHPFSQTILRKHIISRLEDYNYEFRAEISQRNSTSSFCLPRAAQGLTLSFR